MSYKEILGDCEHEKKAAKEIVEDVKENVRKHHVNVKEDHDRVRSKYNALY